MTVLGGPTEPSAYIIPYDVILARGGILQIVHTKNKGHVILWNGKDLIDMIESNKPKRGKK